MIGKIDKVLNDPDYQRIMGQIENEINSWAPDIVIIKFKGY